MRVLFFLLILCATVLNANAQELRVEIPGAEIAFNLILIQKGTHLIGESKVSLDSFWIGKHEVTFDEYIQFQNRDADSDIAAKTIEYKADAISRPSPPYEDFSKGMGRQGGFPAVSMTQQAAVNYCHWLYKKTGIFYRLPTEAEWEYACLQGNSEAEDAEHLNNIAWYFDNSFEKFQKTGEKESNDLGIHDMLGNVAEWTADYYLPKDKYHTFLKDSTAINPWITPLRRHFRTVKGGSYDDNAEDCTCQSRLKSKAKWQARDPQIPKSKWWNTDSPFVGFRLVRPVNQPDKEEIENYFAKAIKY